MRSGGHDDNDRSRRVGGLDLRLGARLVRVPDFRRGAHQGAARAARLDVHLDGPAREG